MIHGVRLVRVLPAALLAALLGGCGGAGPAPQELPVVDAAASAEPTPEATSDPSPEATETPSPVPTVAEASDDLDLPDAVKAETPAGARAFVRHYLELYNTAQESGDTTKLLALASAKCSSCRGFVDSIRKIYDAGGRVEGGHVEVQYSSAPKTKDSDRQVVQVRVQVDPERDFDEKGHQVDKFPGDESDYFFYLVRNAGHWLVDGIKVVVVK